MGAGRGVGPGLGEVGPGLGEVGPGLGEVGPGLGEPRARRGPPSRCWWLPRCSTGNSVQSKAKMPLFRDKVHALHPERLVWGHFAACRRRWHPFSRTWSDQVATVCSNQEGAGLLSRGVFLRPLHDPEGANDISPSAVMGGGRSPTRQVSRSSRSLHRPGRSPGAETGSTWPPRAGLHVPLGAFSVRHDEVVAFSCPLAR